MNAHNSSLERGANHDLKRIRIYRVDEWKVEGGRRGERGERARGDGEGTRRVERSASTSSIEIVELHVKFFTILYI